MARLKDIKLSSDEILKKQFRTKVKGYDPDEVDSFLDDVISDYDTFQAIVEDLYGQIGKLQRQLMEAQKTAKSEQQEQEDIRTYKPSSRSRQGVEADSDQQAESTNMAIIQRVSTLERKVYDLEQNVYGLQK